MYKYKIVWQCINSDGSYQSKSVLLLHSNKYTNEEFAYLCKKLERRKMYFWNNYLTELSIFLMNNYNFIIEKDDGNIRKIESIHVINDWK